MSDNWDDSWEGFKKTVKPIHKKHANYSKFERPEQLEQDYISTRKIAPENIGLNKQHTDTIFQYSNITIGHDHGSNLLKKIKNGSIKVQAMLDLHGFTIADAEVAFKRFIFKSHEEDIRLLLIITGKAYGSSGPTIRKEFQHWVNESAVYIHSVIQAMQKHGGHGAFYVFLKRKQMK